MADVFISYSRKDIEKVKRLKSEIEALGISCWMDINGVESGSKYKNEIVKAINEAIVVLFFLSKNSLDSEYTQKEVGYADKKNKRMVPVNIDGSEPNGWFLFDYADRDIIDSNDIDQKEKLFNDLKKWIFGDSQTNSQSCNVAPEAHVITPSHDIQEVNLQNSPKDEQISKVPVQSEPEDGLITKFTVNGVSFNMVYVRGGTFMMGATAEQGSDAYGDEKPVHQVTLGSYFLGQTVVTRELWRAIMGDNPSTTSYSYSNLQRPVDRVSWYRCQTFIEKLNILTGQSFRLPSEAEWEFAARGGNKSKGFKYAGSNSLGDVAWYRGNTEYINILLPKHGTQAVATKLPNELGLYDMSGNVFEWCQDWKSDYIRDGQINPLGPPYGDIKVYRGGDWTDFDRDCRVSYRSGSFPDKKKKFVGLRLAL